MSNKTKIIVSVVVVTSAFALGRYTTPVKIKTETKIVEVEKKTTTAKKDKQKEKKTTIITNKDGTTHTTIVETEKTKVDKVTTKHKDSTTEIVKEEVKGHEKVYVSVLSGVDFMTYRPVFGASVVKPILGPFTLGAWGLTNATFGASIGLSF